MSSRPKQTEEERKAAIADCIRTFAAGKPGRSLAEIWEIWSERAAIREYLGGLRHRRNAELHAISDTFDIIVERERRTQRPLK